MCGRFASWQGPGGVGGSGNCCCTVVVLGGRSKGAGPGWDGTLVLGGRSKVAIPGWDGVVDLVCDGFEDVTPDLLSAILSRSIIDGRDIDLLR